MSKTLSYGTIIATATRQGATTDQMWQLAFRLITLAHVPADQITSSTRYDVDTLLAAGIRLHPFTVS